MLHLTETGFDLILDGRLILRHTSAEPCLYVGRGIERIDMHRGHFDIADRVVERLALRHAVLSETGVSFHVAPGLPALIELELRGDGNDATLAWTSPDATFNRFWLRLHAEPDEHIWGGGEQFSYLDLRGRHFPLWVSEPGVGRDKTSEISFKANQASGSGGDYWTTYAPQPTFLSSRRYALHVETTAYAAFDFRLADAHEIEIWEVPGEIRLWARPQLTGLVSAISEHIGRPPALPDWAIDGAILGLKDGNNSFARMDRIIAAGVKVTGLWCEDWVGIRPTDFGARLFWDWRANEARYPDLGQRIADLSARGIKFLGYVNPYLCTDGKLFPEAERQGFLARTADGTTYILNLSQFEVGMVDFTNPEACAWFEDAIIGANMLDIGMAGWMADFGEYLPVDAALAGNRPALLEHNDWPRKWAEVNAKAVASRGKTGNAIFFMRSSYAGAQKHCPLLWAGDQSVDFSRHDGLITTVCAALSAGLVGSPYSHSDIGGYTSLYGNKRTPELMMRWAEMAAFTPVMRTHEGNRPRENVQIDDSDEMLAHFARMVRLHCHLVPYLKTLIDEAVATGLPLQRPLFLHHQDDERTYTIQDAYLLGADMLVAPVWHAGAAKRTLYLPDRGSWQHLWSAEIHVGGREVTVPAPFGEPAVFFRVGSQHEALFAGLKAV